jgi:hypothetical protein
MEKKANAATANKAAEDTTPKTRTPRKIKKKLGKSGGKGA